MLPNTLLERFVSLKFQLVFPPFRLSSFSCRNSKTINLFKASDLLMRREGDFLGAIMIKMSPGVPGDRCLRTGIIGEWRRRTCGPWNAKRQSWPGVMDCHSRMVSELGARLSWSIRCPKYYAQVRFASIRLARFGYNSEISQQDKLPQMSLPILCFQFQFEQECYQRK